MTKRKKIKFLYIIVTSMLLFVLSIVLMTVFEYTAVADIKESFIDVDKEKTMEYGKVLFETRGCQSCHAIIPKTKSLGPNLFGISNRNSEDYIRQSIVSPDAVIVEGYADVVMPNFGEILDKRQVQALTEYLLSIK